MIPASKAWFWNCRADPAGSGRGWWWGMESGCNGVGPAHSWSLIDPSSSSDNLSGCCMEGGLEGGWEAQEEAGVELKERRGKKADFGGFLAEQAEANSYLDGRRGNSLCFGRVLLHCVHLLRSLQPRCPPYPASSLLPACLPAMPPASLSSLQELPSPHSL